MEEVELKTATPVAEGAENAAVEAVATEHTDEKSGPDTKEVVAYLVENYPGCFATEGSGNAKPLKIGIFNDLAERINWEEAGFSKTKLRVAVRFYTNSWDYLACVIAGAKRVDLDGVEGEEVSEQHAQYAKERLEESKAKFEAAKAARIAARKAARAAQSQDGERKNRGPRRNNGNRPNARRDQNGAGERKPRNNDRRFGQNNRNNNKVREEVTFEQLDASLVKAGLKVHVMMGSNPVPATVREVVKDVVTVEFETGMAARVAIDRIGK